MKVRCRCRHEMRVPNERYGETIPCPACGHRIHLVRRNRPKDTTEAATVPGDTTALDLTIPETDVPAVDAARQEPLDMPSPHPQPETPRLAAIQKDLQRLMEEKGALEARLREAEHRHDIWARETKDTHQNAQRRLQEQLQQALATQEALEAELVQARTDNRLHDETASEWNEKLKLAEAETESLRAAIAYQREQYATRLEEMRDNGEREISALRETLEVETALAKEKVEAERSKHAAYLETVQKDIARLEAELAEARTTAENATRDAELAQHNLEQVLLSTGNKEEEFREGLDASREEVASALAALEDARNQVRTLETTLAKERESFLAQEKELAAIVEQHRNRAEADRKERDRYEEMLISTRHENANLHVETDKAKAALESLQADLARREQDRFEAQHKLQEAEDALAASRAGIASLEDALAREKIAAERTATRLRDEADAIRKEKTDLQARLIAVQQEVDGLRKTAASLEDALRTEKREHELREARLATDLTQTEQALKDTTLRLDTTLRTKAEMEEAYAEDRARFDTQTSRLRQNLKDLTQRAEHDHHEMTRFQTMLVEARHEHDTLSMQLDKARQALTEQTEATRGDRVGLLGEIRQLEKKLADQTTRVHALEKKLDIQQKLAKNQQEQLRAQHRQQLAILETNANRNQEKATKFSEELDALRRRCATLEQLLETSRERSLELETTLRTDLQRSEGEHKTAAERLEGMEANLRRETERGKRLEDLLLRERESFLRRERDLGAKLAMLEETREADQQEMMRLSMLMDSLQQEILHFQTERDSLEEQAIRMQEEAQATSTKARMLEQALEETREASEAGAASKTFLKDKVAQLEEELAHTLKQMEEEHALREAAEEKLRAGRESILRLERELTRVQVQEDTLREREEDVRTLRRQLQLRTAATEEQTDALTQERDQLKFELTQLRDVLDRLHVERESDIRRLQDENAQLLEASAASKAFLKEKIARLQSELESARAGNSPQPRATENAHSMEAAHTHRG